MAALLDGRKTSEKIIAELKPAAEALGKNGHPVRLAIVTIGEDPASAIYTRMKTEACKRAGIASETMRLENTIAQAELEAKIRELNARSDITAIIIQLPLPRHIDTASALDAIDPQKDADGLSAKSLGTLMHGKTELMPATAKGIDLLLNEYGISVKGMDAAVIGRGIETGRPIAAYLIAKGATVTVCNSTTKDLKAKTTAADIIISAAGKAGLVTGEMVKPGAIVIDAGISRKEKRVEGDVEFESASKKASFITPVPGGVGPMTVAALLSNALMLARNNKKIDCATP